MWWIVLAGENAQRASTKNQMCCIVNGQSFLGARINLFAYQAHCQSSIPCLADNSDDRLWTIVLEEESIDLPKFQW